MARQILPWIVLLSALLHGIGIARTRMPAQDGLKFLRVAGQFQSQPFVDVVRSSDQHPLYPALIAVAEPVVASALGRGPTSWRVAAQGVSALAAIATIVPIFWLGRALFGHGVGALAALLFVLLPETGALGHDTLSDPVALLGFAWSLCLGEQALRTGRLGPAIGSGVSAGLGFWARPEVAVVALVALGVGVVGVALRAWGRATAPGEVEAAERLFARPLPALAVTFLALVGSYAVVKGEVSEKLALRRSAAIASKHDAPRGAGRGLPDELAGPLRDFVPKEESGRSREFGVAGAMLTVAHGWAEGLGGAFAALAIWGAWRVRAQGPGRGLVAAYVCVFALVLVRHALLLDYLSGRHALTIVVATLPWGAAGLADVCRRVSRRLGWSERSAPRRRYAAIAALIAVGTAVQLKPAHASRASHEAAARWLAAHAGPGDAVLDTRGWAAFLSGLRGYGPWHVAQALSDSRLSFVVVGADELAAESRRAAALRAVLDYSAEPAARFASADGDDVRVYRFHRPASWEGLRR